MTANRSQELSTVGPWSNSLFDGRTETCRCDSGFEARSSLILFRHFWSAMASFTEASGILNGSATVIAAFRHSSSEWIASRLQQHRFFSRAGVGVLRTRAHWPAVPI